MQELAVSPPAYSPVTMIPFYSPKAINKRFYFVNIANVTYIKINMDTNKTKVLLARSSQRKEIELELPPTIKYVDYIRQFVPHFVRLGTYAINPSCIMEVYPGSSTTTLVDVLYEDAKHRNLNLTETLEFRGTCGEILESISAQDSLVSRTYFPSIDIGFGQTLG
ncbi:hypothetical protein HK103_005144 [Boothiomyces macroporosus]|uniref:Uncharacterized protein n=1 Tax=Boothiomyces macroporosus TaxID=261099 RepID=A0AAD5UID1_9FUNG|nr:hypothetical protein HK103_005144 [Boothiomyces macroporosus]